MTSRPAMSVLDRRQLFYPCGTTYRAHALADIGLSRVVRFVVCSGCCSLLGV
ncbi:hypothetical protein Lalb_Chr20g0111771 [Lupinus albus]|uniref:Uncharacterized protein n=1 Tax=Lupinus albus TaxID=3870 RepID=A0A6A4NNL0_LUPAL|nr:hypothetical protein Lalb_Chr20g0111771 [Lupinus albus]